MNNWLEILKAECAKEGVSQNSVAKKLHISAAQLSLVLKGTYTGDLGNISRKVQQILMRDEVACPFYGVISGEECNNYQNAPFISTNSSRAKLYKMCLTCPHREKKEN